MTPVRADLTTYDGVGAVWAAVQATGRPLDVAALNAGMGMGVGGAARQPLTLGGCRV